MRNLLGKIGALAAGALAMYYLDPQLGPARRAALRDLLLRGGTAADASRPGRLGRRIYHRIPESDPQRDAELRESIRLRLDRLVSFPRALNVEVKDGVVRLSGTVLTPERDALLLQVQAMPGVQKLVNAMTSQDRPASIAGLPTAPDKAGVSS